MFCQHKLMCENKELILYLFLFDQDISVHTMTVIFSQMPSSVIKKRTQQYLMASNFNKFCTSWRIVYHSTIIRELQFPSALTHPTFFY